MKNFQLLFFICKRGRSRDVQLLRDGVGALGFNFYLLVLPYCYPILPLILLLKYFNIKTHIIISDNFRGDLIFAKLFGASSVRMLWNYADEFPSCLNSEPSKRVCFFDEDNPQVKKFIFAPHLNASPYRTTPSSSVIFVGDIDMSCQLPGGGNWWADRLQELLEVDGYGFYLSQSFSKLLMNHLSTTDQKRRAKVFSKNFLRLKIIEAARSNFGEKIILVGANWRRYGLDSLPSMYDSEKRLNLYRAAAIHLDCGSKSGDNALYPRSSEIISFSGAPLQVICSDSQLVYGDNTDEIVFSNENMLCELLEDRLSENFVRQKERSEKLAASLIERHLTMADSLRGLLSCP